MGFRYLPRGDQILFGTIAVCVLIGIAPGVLFSWKVLVGLSILLGFAWFLTGIFFLIDVDGATAVHTGLVFGMPCAIVVWWATFFIAWGLRT